MLRRRTYLNLIAAGGGGALTATTPGRAHTDLLYRNAIIGQEIDATQVAKLVPDEEISHQSRLGSIVALDGDTAMVGAPPPVSPEAAGTRGAVYVFENRNEGWTQTATLVTEEPAPDGQFGSFVLLDGDTAFVSAPEEDAPGPTGAVYVFERSGETWDQRTKLTGDEDDDGADFGSSMEIEGDTLLIAAPSYISSELGTVYVFERNDTRWVQQSKLTPNDGNEEVFYFGMSIDLDGNTALISAATGGDYNGDEVSWRGLGYLFESDGTTWVRNEQIVAFEQVTRGDPRFWVPVALEDSTAVFGEPMVADPRSGAVYVYRQTADGWSQQTKLTGEGNFGSWVVRRGNAILVGAPNYTGSGKPGTVSLFQHGSGEWDRAAQLSAGETDEHDIFGGHFALDENRTLIGTVNGNPNADPNGAAYLFELDGVDLTTETATEQNTSTQSGTSPANENGPGFGFMSAVAGLGAAGYLLKRRFDTNESDIP